MAVVPQRTRFLVDTRDLLLVMGIAALACGLGAVAAGLSPLPTSSPAPAPLHLGEEAARPLVSISRPTSPSIGDPDARASDGDWAAESLALRRFDDRDFLLNTGWLPFHPTPADPRAQGSPR